jgi:hypothetical protein
MRKFDAGDAFFTVVGLLIWIALFGLLSALPVMWLWNGCLVPAVSGVHEIGWIQAWGINVLCAFLFQSSVSKND